MSTRQHRLYARLRKRALTLFIAPAVLLVSWAGCGSKSFRSINGVCTVSCDVSPRNSQRTIRTSEYSGVHTFTVSEDEAINHETLERLLNNLRADRPQLVICLPSENWVFYVSHNGESDTEVMLHLVAEGGVEINGMAHEEASHVAPGAHGYRVISQESPVQIEHLFLPLQ